MKTVDPVISTVARHFEELIWAKFNQEISDQDYEITGYLLSRNLGYLLSLSETGWTNFTRIVNESRQVVQTMEQQKNN